MILPFSIIDIAEAEVNNKNPKDKTLERIQEKVERELVLKEQKSLDIEEKDLKKRIKSEKNISEKIKINKRIAEIKSQKDEIERINHMKDIPKTQVERLIHQQDTFERKLLNSDAVKFVTSIGIDITSKEIQIGLNKNIVNSDNIDLIVSELEQMMPQNIKWHVVYSTPAEALSCNQNECTPIIGGNYIKVSGMEAACSFGFQAKKGLTRGWITAGHCADGRVGSSVKDYSNDNIGTVSSEKSYWGNCDCAWITSGSSIADNKVYGGGTHIITKTTSASGQQNDTIMKSGQGGGVDFGTVSAIHVTVLNVAQGEYVRDLVRSNTVMAHGDSGGTVVESGDKGDLYGIVATHDWWGYYHTPIDQITSQMGITAVLN